MHPTAPGAWSPHSCRDGADQHLGPGVVAESDADLRFQAGQARVVRAGLAAPTALGSRLLGSPDQEEPAGPLLPQFPGRWLEFEDRGGGVDGVVQAAFAGKRIVIFSGGSKTSSDAFFDDIRGIRDGGGFGSIIGSMVGTLIPTVLRTGFIIGGINPFWQQVVIGAVLIAAVFTDQRRRKPTEWM